jgi:hypothetical protein
VFFHDSYVTAKDLVIIRFFFTYNQTAEIYIISNTKNLVRVKQISCDSGQFAPYEDETHAISDVKVRFQTFPKDLSGWLIDELPELNCVKHDFSHSIYVVEIDGAIRYGIGKGKDMYLTACDRDALFKGYVARACSKLDEALYVKGIKLTKEMLGKFTLRQ